MSFWIQHGYGKGDKIVAAASEYDVAGVILSPADERDSLASTVNSVSELGLNCILDPQLYVHTIPDAEARCHEFHELDFHIPSSYLSAGEVASHVQAIIDLNQSLGTNVVIGPSPLISAFGDGWSNLAMQYARETEQHTDHPWLASLVAEASAFADWDQVRRYLDVVTTLDTAGIYLIVANSRTSYPFSWDRDILKNVLKTIYVLAEFAEYEVVWGYADIPGAAGLSVGASGAATGWFNSLRYFAQEKWIPQSGGRAANPRLFARSLMCSVRRDSEAVGMARTRLSRRVFPEDEIRRGLRSSASWSLTESWAQHLSGIAELYELVDKSLSVESRVRSLLGELDVAINLVSQVEAAGVAIDAAHGNGLRSLRDALSGFAQEEL